MQCSYQTGVDLRYISLRDAASVTKIKIRMTSNAYHGTCGMTPKCIECTLGVVI